LFVAHALFSQVGGNAVNTYLSRKRASVSRHSKIEELEPRRLLSALVWSAGTPIPKALANAVALPYGYDILVAGGTGGGTGTAGSSSSVYEWNGTNWQTDLSLNSSRAGAGIGQTIGYGPLVQTSEGLAYKYTTEIMVYGGKGSTSPSATMLNYDPNSGGDYTDGPSMSAARYDFAYATDASNGDLYAIGGLGTGNTVLSSVEYYDPTTDSWSSVASLPQGVYNATATSDGEGHIFVFGGDNSSGQPIDTVYRYTIATNSWDTGSPMPVAASEASAVDAAYGMIYVIGGLSSSGALSDVNWYNPVTDTWTEETSLPSAVYGAATVIDLNGNVDVIGGYDSTGTATSAVFISPVGPAPTGLPATPTITIAPYAVYNGQQQPLTLQAIGSDGMTPVDGNMAITYDGSTTAPTEAGTYNVVAVFTSNDPNYVNTAAKGAYTIYQATPTITVTGGGTFTYNGQPHTISATQVGIDGQTPVNGTFTYTYNGSTTPPVNGGTYTAVANFTSNDPNYSNASATTTITIPDPTIPTGVTVTGISTSAITVSWNPCPVSVGYYKIYKQYSWHGPKGGGGTAYALLTTTTNTSITVSATSGTFEVTSVSASGVESARSLPASGSAWTVPDLWGASTLGGVTTSSQSLFVGQTGQIQLLWYYGNPAVTFTVVSGPSGVYVNPSTGIVTYTPSAADVGSVPVTFKASNAAGSSTFTFNYTVSTLPGFSISPGGQYTISGPSAAVQTLDVISGTATLSANIGTSLSNGALTVENGVTVVLASSQTLTALQLNGTGTLDVGQSSVIINYGTGPDPAATMLQWLASGSNGGAWNGTGIVSSAAAVTPGYGVGFGDGADGIAAGVTAGQIKLMYTLNGDVDLNGIVNGVDFGILAPNLNMAAPKGWEQGDFNYDGVVNGIDFNEMSANFNQAVSTSSGTQTTNLTAATTTPVSSLSKTGRSSRNHHGH
jgi:hypothetical protein